MEHIQLELNLKGETDMELKISSMQKQLEDMHESMGKVRRKLFSEMGDLKKSFFDLQKENEKLKLCIKDRSHEKQEWSYKEEGCLFNVSEYSKSAG